MNVLITGSNGFLGKLICAELEKENKIFELSRNSGNYRVTLESIIPVFKDNFDIVIHSAGKAHSIPKNEIQKKEFYDVNVTGTLNLLKGLEKCTLPKQFVFISSVSVYGEDFGNNINENHSLNATDPYGLSKIEAEQLVRSWCEKNIVTCTILRLPLLVGENPPGNLGAMIKAITQGYYFNIANGKARKSMVLAKDVAAFILRAAERGGIYNLTDGFHPSFSELSLAISRSRNKRRPLNLPKKSAKLVGIVGDYLGSMALLNSLKVKKMTSDLTFDDTRARTILDWKPQSVVEYLKNNKI